MPSFKYSWTNATVFKVQLASSGSSTGSAGKLLEKCSPKISPFNYGSAGDESGIDALRATMHRFLDSCGATQHLLGSITVDIIGDTAASRSYVEARHQRIGEPAGPVFDSNGE